MFALKNKKEAEVILYQKYKLEHPREVSEVIREAEERKVKEDKIPKFIKRLSCINRKVVMGICVAACFLLLGIAAVPAIQKSIVENINGTVDLNVTPVQGEISEIKKELESVKGIAVDTKEDVNAVTGVLKKKETEAKVVVGKDGKSGLPGEPGLPGVAGLPGIAGKDGLPGLAGASGQSGVNGKDGIEGAPGITGKDGITGIDGEAGIDGANGKDGEAGKDGSNGLNGADGKSAYTAAVEAGYTGTEAEYAVFMASTPQKIVDLDGNITTLNNSLTTSVETINQSLTETNTKVEECFTSVSSGKSLLAATLTDKELPTAADATFATINEGINNLYTKGFADGVGSVNPNGTITYVRHNHTGDNKSGGGCYTKANYHTHSSACYGMCPNKTCFWDHNTSPTEGTWWGVYLCGTCKFSVTYDGGGIFQHIEYPHTRATSGCGYTSGQLLGYLTECGYQENQIISATITY